MKKMKSEICISIGNLSYDEVLAHLKKISFAEIRIDLLNFSAEHFHSIFKSHHNLIASYRSGKLIEGKKAEALINALHSGASYVDIEVNTEEIVKKEIVELAKKLNRKVIISYHNYNSTPAVDELYTITENLFKSGADIAKLACMVNSPEDNARILGLYAHFENLIAIGMGSGGVLTRVIAPLMGSPFAYASIAGHETAPGQLDEVQLKTVINLLDSYTSGKE